MREKPSEYVRRHFRATTEPAQLPPGAPERADMLEMIGPELLMFASDHPHDHGGSGARLLEAVEPEVAEGILRANASAFYRLDAHQPV